MFQKELINLLSEVITSWQVIAVVIALVLYLNIVFFVSKPYHRPKVAKKTKAKKKSQTDAAVVTQQDDDTESNSNNELGLEEA